jgi:N-acetylneuraminic acid mutarotase
MKKISLLAGRLLALLLVVGSLGLLNGCKKNDDTTSVYGNWTKASSFAGAARNAAVTFTINNIAYVGTGIDAGSNRYNDLWAFNPATGSWTQMMNFPGDPRSNAVAFAANGKGYVGAGYNGSIYYSDFYEFTPPTAAGGTGSWRKIADLSTAAGTNAPRRDALAGSVNNIGYVGCGYGGTSNNNYLKDFYQYNPATNTWAALVNGFPGEKRIGGLTFTLNNQLYVGFGVTNSGTAATDFFAYNPTAGTWTPTGTQPGALRSLANISNSTDSYDYSGVARTNAVAFTANNLGYVALGTVGTGGTVLTSCYEYNPSDDTWTLKNPFVAAGRSGAVGFGINNIGYVGLGNSGSTRFDDLWQFDPNASQQ